jgi:serine/threonine protein kinase
MICPFCGTDNPVGETFCANCGGYLEDLPASSQAEPGTADETVRPAPIDPAEIRPAPIDPPASGQPNSNTGTRAETTQGNSTTLHPTVELENGRYVVEKILGQGGMGAAVLARDTRIANKPVVIKELISDENDPKQRQQDVENFKHEVETLATLDHPLIPTVTDSFQEGPRYYMVQEYAPGENLEDHLERVKKPMPEQEALTYISQVLDILDYLEQHKPPIIHRDIKPANIIISSRDKRARLVDFGIARADEAKNAQRKQTSALGTPGYAPPEQYQGNADTRSDLYALAATLHHLVTNRDPRDEAPFSYPLARTINSQVSTQLERVLEHALSMDIKKRYQSAAEMKHAIDDILQARFHTTGDTSSYVLNPSRPITPPPPAKPQPATSRTQNRPSNRPRPATSYNDDDYDEGYRGGYGPVQTPPRYQAPQRPYNINQDQQYESYGRQRQQQMGMFSPPQNQGQNNNYLWFSFALLIIVVVIIALLLVVFPLLAHSGIGLHLNQNVLALTNTIQLQTQQSVVRQI